MARKEKKEHKIGSAVRAPNGRMVAAYSNSDLYQLVSLAARETKPRAPDTLSVREFDRSLGTIGYPDAPSGRAIYGRLKRPWPEIVALSLREASPARFDDPSTRQKEGHWMTLRHLFFALKTLARLKGVTTFTVTSYDATRAAYLAAPERQRDLEMHEQHLPTSSQILRIAAALETEGSTPWEKALLYAGLSITKEELVGAMPLEQAIDYYITATGLLPSYKEIERLGREWEVALAMSKRKPWPEAMEACRALRAARGEVMPTAAAKQRALPALKKPTALDGATPYVKRGKWQDEKLVIERLTIYVLDCRAQSIRPKQKHYMEWRKSRKDFPASSTLNRQDWGFAAWIALVEERLLQEKKAA